MDRQEEVEREIDVGMTQLLSDALSVPSFPTLGPPESWSPETRAMFISRADSVAELHQRLALAPTIDAIACHSFRPASELLHAWAPAVERIAGSSATMLELRTFLYRHALSNRPVAILSQGSGLGKALAGRTLHAIGQRRGPCVELLHVNDSALGTIASLAGATLVAHLGYMSHPVLTGRLISHATHSLQTKLLDACHTHGVRLVILGQSRTRAPDLDCLSTGVRSELDGVLVIPPLVDWLSDLPALVTAFFARPPFDGWERPEPTARITEAGLRALECYLRKDPDYNVRAVGVFVFQTLRVARSAGWDFDKPIPMDFLPPDVREAGESPPQPTRLSPG